MVLCKKNWDYTYTKYMYSYIYQEIYALSVDYELYLPTKWYLNVKLEVLFTYRLHVKCDVFHVPCKIDAANAKKAERNISCYIISCYNIINLFER